MSFAKVPIMSAMAQYRSGEEAGRVQEDRCLRLAQADFGFRCRRLLFGLLLFCRHSLFRSFWAQS